MEESDSESLRQLAPCWNLAGDQQLLNVLQNTHQKIIAKCKAVTDNLESMVVSLDDASITLQNVNNRFMALSNRQFIESRVYDDDDVTTDQPASKESPKAKQDSDVMCMKRSLQVLENVHETITILNDSDTDTESEDEMTSRTVLRPKDMYSDRPLPYVIGTQAWKNKWHAGLVCSDSDSDSSVSKRDRRSEYSDSEPETRPEQSVSITTHLTVSETSSEHPSEQDVLQSVAAKPTPSDMAAELARRLGGQPPKMEEEPDHGPPAPTTRKFYKPQQPTTGTIFPDEPPPLDDSDSPEDDIFAELHKNQPYSNHQPVADDIFYPQAAVGRDANYDEGDIFSDFAVQKPQPKPAKSTPLFDEPNMLEDKSGQEQTAKHILDDSKSFKKPIGGISLFGTNKGAESIGAAIINRNRRKSSTSGDDSGSDSMDKALQKDEHINKEKDIFDDLFAKSAKSQKSDTIKDKADVAKGINVVVDQKKDIPKDKKVDLFSDNIFDDIDDIFTNNVVKVPEKNQKSIFDDDDDLFSEIAAPQTIKPEALSSRNTKILFDSDEDELFAAKTNSDVKNTSNRINIGADINKNKTEKEIMNDIQQSDTINEISSILDNGNNLLSNVITTNKIVQNVTVSHEVNRKPNDLSNRDNLSKSHGTITSGSKLFNSPSLFDDDDDEDLFAKPKSSNLTQKDTLHGPDILKSSESDILKPGNDLFSRTVETDIIQKDTIIASEKNEILLGTDDLFNSKTTDDIKIDKTISKDTNLKSSRDYERKDSSKITTAVLAKDVTDEIIHSNETNDTSDGTNNKNTNIIISRTDSGDSDFEQDFDDILVQDNKETTNSLPKFAEINSSNIFENTIDDLFRKSKMIDNKINQATITKTDVQNLKYVQKDFNINSNNDNVPIVSIIDKSSETSNNSNQDTAAHETEIKNDNKIPDLKLSKDTFNVITSEPPIFEKPKEPKRSKNVNALFDDDSDDEALFYKKDDVIDEKPDDVQNQARFDIFTDEPPDEQYLTTLNSDNDDIFSSISKPGLIDKNVTGNSDKNMTNQEIQQNFDSKTDFGSENDSDEDIFKTGTKQGIKSYKIEGINSYKHQMPAVETEHKTTPSKFQINVNELPESTKENISSVAESKNQLSDYDDLFKSSPQLETNIQPLTSSTVNNKNEDTGKFDNEELFKELSKNRKYNESEVLDKEFNTSEATQTENNLETKDESPKKVGKLKTMNFNINVNALLPGASPKRQKAVSGNNMNTTIAVNPNSKYSEPAGTDTLESNKDFPNPVSNIIGLAETVKTDSTQSNKEFDITDSNGFHKTQSEGLDSEIVESLRYLDKTDSKMVKSISFDGEQESVILDNKLSKERAKIQVKRRPSTRRARREAVRKSAIDFGDDSTDNTSSVEELHNTQSQIDKNIRKDVLDNINFHEPTEAVTNTDILSEVSGLQENIKREDCNDNKIINENLPTQIETVQNIRTVSEKSEIFEDIKNKVDSKTVDSNLPRQIEEFKSTERAIAKSQTVNESINDSLITKPENSNISENICSRDVKSKIVYVLNDEDIFNTSVDQAPTLSTIGNIYRSKTNLDQNTEKSEVESTKITRIVNDNLNTIFKSDHSEESILKIDSKNTKIDVNIAKKSIFDSDSDEDLFTSKREIKKVVKGRLFSDDDDDDLFGVRKKKNELKPQASSSIREPSKTTELVFDDPLSLLGDDE